jgi:hypothetical protein
MFLNEQARGDMGKTQATSELEGLAKRQSHKRPQGRWKSERQERRTGTRPGCQRQWFSTVWYGIGTSV